MTPLLQKAFERATTLPFHAHVEKLKKMPNSEISEISLDDNLPGKLTYPKIQPDLFHKVKTELAEYRR